MIANDKTSSSSWLAYIFLVATALCWGLNAVLGKLAVDQIQPMQLVALRWFGGTLLLFIVYHKQISRDWPVLSRRLPYAAIMALIGFTLFNSLFYEAAHTTTVLNIGILQGSIPVFVILLSVVFTRHKLGLLQAIGVFITIVGVIVVASKGDLDRLTGLVFTQGDVYMLLACMLYAGYSFGLMNRPAVSGLSLLAIFAAMAALFSVPLVFWEAARDGWILPTPKGWFIGFLAIIFPTVLAQFFFIRGVSIIGAVRAGVFVNLVPVFSTLMAVTYLAESFELFHALSLALVLGGIWLSETGKKIA